MKKTGLKLLAAVSIAFTLAACSSGQEQQKTDQTDNVLVVGATTTPHGEILEKAVPLLADQGITLKVREFSDWPNINPSTSDGSLDANYFQHDQFLNGYNQDNQYKSGDDGYLVSVGAIHYEPLGVYSQKYKTVEEAPEGALFLIPNDPSNESRALLLLQDLGLITLKEGATLEKATVADIESNPKKLKFEELAADQIATKLQDADYVVVNGNYALASNITEHLLKTEADDSQAATTYQNIIAVKESQKDNEAVKKLVEVLKSDEIKNFIKENYKGFAVPAK